MKVGETWWIRLKLFVRNGLGGAYIRQDWLTLWKLPASIRLASLRKVLPFNTTTNVINSTWLERVEEVVNYAYWQFVRNHNIHGQRLARKQSYRNRQQRWIKNRKLMDSNSRLFQRLWWTFNFCRGEWTKCWRCRGNVRIVCTTKPYRRCSSTRRNTVPYPDYPGTIDR
jgi:hypothetical protein